ncbi:hypothetical protein TrCOL_g6877 [Triparma columacea]|uniref:Tyrosine-protein kinase ephrin type A/B receptor-like domain-containing protein n=1 Tax=Triparma columacea TaxID=722753 RepID=A0A9W7LCW4_9STRA|nr:hypothetical protein TrCOL_g6877 [Triparma columacea]
MNGLDYTSGGVNYVYKESCKIGHYCGPSASSYNLPAPNGTYVRAVNALNFTLCEPGTFQPRMGMPSCLVCPVGYFCPDFLASVSLLFCPAGFVCDEMGLRTAVTPCIDGYYCKQGTKTSDVTSFPDGGDFVTDTDTGLVTVDVSARPWSLIARISPASGSRRIEHPSDDLSLTAEMCLSRTPLDPEKCPAGFVCASLGLSVPAMLCPPGYYCEEGTLTVDPSDPLIQGPKACSAGVFCLGGVAHDLTIDWVPGFKTGVSASQTCTEGSYCQAASTAATGSGPCFPGHYCKPGSVYPEKVPLGNFASRAGSVASTLCFPGSYAPLRATEECRGCPAGFTCHGCGTYEPIICEAGTFRSKADSVTCRLCPAGTFSPYQGATDISQCLPCPAGRVCGIQGMTNMSASVSCPGGYTCGAGTNRANQFKHKCPAGYFCEPNTVPARQFDLTCEKGHYCLRGTPLYLATRNKCNVRFFCPPGTSSPNSPLTKCPKRTVSLTGATSLSECIIEEVDVCDKGTLPYIGDNNPFEDKSFYPRHEYRLLSYDENLYDSAPLVKFNSEQERNPTGEV